MRKYLSCDLNKLQAQLKSLENLATEQQDQWSRELGPDITKNANEFVSANSGNIINFHYKHVGEAAKSIVADVEEKTNAETGKLFLRLVIIQSIIKTIAKRLVVPLPNTLAVNQLRHFERMVGGKNMGDDWLDIDNDLFQKEFGLASERLFAAGSQLLDKNCGIPRSIVFKDGIVKSPKKLWFFSGLLGFKPLIQIHTHTFNLDKFNEEGWNECYFGCVELYQVFPQLLGVFGSSWFYDPVVADISPRLKYLQRIPESGGAKFFYYSSGGSAVGLATSTSESRKKMFDEGKYSPKSYMMVWGRQSQVEWVDGLESGIKY